MLEPCQVGRLSLGLSSRAALPYATALLFEGKAVMVSCSQVHEEMLDLGDEMCSEEVLLPSVYEEVLRRPRVREKKPELLWLFSFVAVV